MSVDTDLNFVKDQKRLFRADFELDSFREFLKKFSKTDPYSKDMEWAYYEFSACYRLYQPEEIMSYLYQASVMDGTIYEMPVEFLNFGRNLKFPIKEMASKLSLSEDYTKLIKMMFNMKEIMFRCVEINHTASDIALCIDTRKIPVSTWMGGGMYIHTTDTYCSSPDVDIQYRKDVCEKNGAICLDESIVKEIKSFFNIKKLCIEDIGLDYISRKIILYPSLNKDAPTPKRWKRHYQNDKVTII